MSLVHRYADIDLEAALLALIDSSMDTALEQTSDFPSEEAARVKRLAKSGLKSESFAREALELARLHEELLPRGLDLERLERTIRNRDAIRSRLRKAQKLVQRLQVLSVLLGVDSYSDALDIYHSLKRHGTDQSLRAAVKELGRIFKRSRQKEEEPEQETPSSQGGPEPTTAEEAYAVADPVPRANSETRRFSKPGDQGRLDSPVHEVPTSASAPANGAESHLGG